jgi:hypothetical protein
VNPIWMGLLVTGFRVGVLVDKVELDNSHLAPHKNLVWNISRT